MVRAPEHRKTTWVLAPDMTTAKAYLSQTPELVIRDRGHNLFIAIRPVDLQGRVVQPQDDLVDLGGSDELHEQYQIAQLRRPSPLQTPADVLKYVKERLRELDG